MALKIEGLAAMLMLSDMPRSIAFYRDVDGFELVGTSQPGNGDEFDWGLRRLNGMELTLNTAYEKHARPATLEGATSLRRVGDAADLSPTLPRRFWRLWVATVTRTPTTASSSRTPKLTRDAIARASLHSSSFVDSSARSE